MSDNKILAAMRQLDTENDNHWTSDGLPRLETVKMLAGDQTLNREAVDAAAPGFSRKTAKDYQGDGAQGNGAGTDGTAIGVAANLGAEGQAAADAATPATAPSAESLRGTDNDTLREQASEPGLNNLNAEGGASDGPSVPDEVQAAAAAGAAVPPAPPEITQGATERGFNALATPESDAYDAAISTAHGPTTPPALGGPGDLPAREGEAPVGQSAEQPTDQGAILGQGEAKLSEVEHGTVGNPDAIEALEAELEEASQLSGKLRGYADEIAAELQTSTANEARLRNALEAARPRAGVMPAIQSYFASQDAAAEQLIAARQAITDSGVDLKALTGITALSPIDKAAADANKPNAAK